jgi:hypothetical protein
VSVLEAFAMIMILEAGDESLGAAASFGEPGSLPAGTVCPLGLLEAGDVMYWRVVLRALAAASGLAFCWSGDVWRAERWVPAAGGIPHASRKPLGDLFWLIRTGGVASPEVEEGLGRWGDLGFGGGPPSLLCPTICLFPASHKNVSI